MGRYNMLFSNGLFTFRYWSNNMWASCDIWRWHTQVPVTQMFKLFPPYYFEVVLWDPDVTSSVHSQNVNGHTSLNTCCAVSLINVIVTKPSTVFTPCHCSRLSKVQVAFNSRNTALPSVSHAWMQALVDKNSSLAIKVAVAK